MKKILLPGALAFCLVMMSSSNQAIAQEDEKTTVHITIKEDGVLTTDTTFELKEGQDPDMVKEMVHHLAGEDDVWHAESGDIGINLDSLREAHGGGKVLVIKDTDGNITVKEPGEDEEPGDHEIMIFESDEGNEKVDVYVVKKVKVEVDKESGKGMEKEVEVEVKTEKEKK
jgi:hypothetical protein